MDTNKLHQLVLSFFEKEKLYRKKTFRSRKWESMERNKIKRDLYSNLYRRASDLSYRLERYKYGKDIIDYTDRIFIVGEYNARLKRKAEGKEKFLYLHTYFRWFMSELLGADYGLYKCDKCGCEFYHSPSTIKLAKKTIYNCCCGYCTNTIIHQDWKKDVYF